MATRTTFSFTQKSFFEGMIQMLNGGECPFDTDEAVAFCNHQIEKLVKRAEAPKKLTPQQVENEGIKQGILANMEVGERYTIGDMLTGFDCFPAGMTPQRVSALLSQLGAKGTGEVVRTEEKGKAYFSLA